ncbi:MAG: NADH:flavin oxidoreductase/NADH oxidase [Phycisphaerae bacterium]
MPHLFSPIRLRDLEIRNRVWVSPMCMYSSDDGMPTDWHMTHLGSRAVGGAGMVMVEATAVTPEGRISPWDSGIWANKHVGGFAPITAFLKKHGATPAIQLAHAGRKASTDAPWRGGKPLRVGDHPLAWEPVAPSPIPFDDDHATPREMTPRDIDQLVADFVAATRRALAAGFEVVEVHAAHGYLLHEFLSPLSNKRTDDYGGPLENRMRAVLRVSDAVRKEWPAKWPVLVRISATDWADGGWDLPQSIELSKRLRAIGIDLIDCSSGALVPRVKIPIGPGYQVPFAETIRREALIATGAVGMITEPQQANDIIESGQADPVLIARAFLRDPYWAANAARALEKDVPWPAQYGRA